MGTDLRIAARFLSKSPLFTAGIIALLAAGIAANTVIFSLVDALLLRPAAVRDPERLVRLVTIRPPLPTKSDFLLEEYDAWKKNVPGFEDVLAWSEHDMFVAHGDLTERARIHFVTDNFFSALGAAPALGRLLTPQDQQLAAGTAPVVLSHPYWQRRFAGDAGIVGRTITLAGRKVAVVGVAAQGFNGLTVETSPDVMAPIGWLRGMLTDADDNKIYCEVVARLRAGASAEAVQQQAEATWRSNWAERNAGDPGSAGRFELQSAARGISHLRTQFTGVLWLLMGGAALLMLMVCANVAGLLMARTASRQGELAVRVALGATRLQLVRQLFCEALLLMLGGVAGALALTFVLLPLAVRSLPPVRDLRATLLTLSLDVTPDWRVLGFAVAVSVATVLLFGLIPALLAASRDLHSLLKESRAGGGWRGRQVLVAVQVALCTILLVGSGLTIRTLQRLEGMNAGFQASRVVTFGVDPEMAHYGPGQSAELERRLLEAARALPDVESASISSRGLMRGTGIKATFARAGERAREGDFLNTSMHAVSPEYFATMRIAWVAGRNFTGREDLAATPKPVIVNEAFVRRLGAGRPVLGAKFGTVVNDGAPAKPLVEVIGVVADTKYRSLREPFQPIIYQIPTPGQSFIAHLRTRAAPESVIPPMRRILAGIDPRLSYVEVTTLANEVAASLWTERVAASLATGFSAAAGIIVAAGLYALIAFAVLQRRREIGIRMALGALPRDVVRLILAKAAGLAAAGIVLGLFCAWVLAPRISSILYEVRPHDWTVLGVAAALTLLIAGAAASIPSLRAARIHPSSVLRQE